ncbi:MAG: ATP-dependent DNA helicase UvrD2 [Actinomycetes bacterium]
MSVATLSEVLAALDPEQHEAAVAPRGPVCILAGAGSGKTRALTHRIAALSLGGLVDPRHVLALTFTARAAGELRGRLRGLGVDGVQARTFHAAALRQLRYFWPQAIGGQPPAVAPSKAPLIAEACRRLRVRSDPTTIRDLAAEIEWAKVTEVTPDAYPSRSTGAGRAAVADLDPAVVSRIYAGYEAVKRDRSLIDFEDVLLLSAAMLADAPTMAQAVRDQYRCLMVDEYQDVSPIQQRLLDLWLGDRDDLTVVGDPNQMIYSFAGASSQYLLDFPKRYSNAAVIRLERNYRSTPQVVHLANRLMTAAAAPSVVLVSQQPTGPEPKWEAAPHEPAEVDGVVARIQDLIGQGVPRREIAILYRINAQSVAFEEALADADIAYTVRGGERFFDRAEVKEAIALLRGAARSDDAADEADSLSHRVSAILGAVGYQPSAPAGPSQARNRWESWAALVALAQQMADANAGATLVDLVDELQARASAAHAPAADAVTLSSLHAAKGLEWQAVFLVGLTDGMVPITYASTPQQVAEERRLLYVGITRAREHVTLSFARARNVGDRRRREPSRFLAELHPEFAVSAPPRGRSNAVGPASCRQCGRALTTPSERKLRYCSTCGVDVDLALFEKLREWRKSTADAASVPAFVVFTDATLTAIAVEHPLDASQLLSIPGIGNTKVERYGDDLLDVVKSHAVATAASGSTSTRNEHAE